MKITKYEHSCLDLKIEGKRLIIDAGVYSSSLVDYSNIAVVIVTHVHPDHFDPEKLQRIAKHNPGIKILTTVEVAEKLKIPEVEVARTGQNYTFGPFNLEFFGEMHAVISPDFPPPHNIGVLVNDILYDPGDSFTHCPKTYTILTLPIMAPWLKLSESLEYIKQSPATTLIPVHNGFINEGGEQVYANWLKPACEKLNKNYNALKPGESLTI